MPWLYLIHFDRPYVHARHYLGATGDLRARLLQHNAGMGGNILKVINDAGIGWQLVRCWRTEAAFQIESHRKKIIKNSSVLCPICNPNPVVLSTCYKYDEIDSETIDEFPLNLLPFDAIQPFREKIL